MAIEPWIPIKASLPNHPKTDELMEVMGCSRNEAVGILARLMLWVRQNAPYGIMAPRNLADKIAKECDWKTDPADFLNRLILIGWIDKRPDETYFFHDWDDHNYALIKSEQQRERNMANNRERQRRYKARERQAQINRYKADGYNALGNGEVTRYPTGGEKMEKGELFGNAEITGEVTRYSLLDQSIKHPHSRVIQFFLDCYKTKRGEEYIGGRNRMAGNIKELKKEYPEEEIARRIKNYFESTDPYYSDTVKFDWATFYTQFNRLDKPVAGREKNNSQQRSKDNGFDKPKGTEQTIDDFQ